MTQNPKASTLTQKITQIIQKQRPKDVKKLASLMKNQLQITERQALNIILRLQREGKIKLKTQQLPSSLNLSTYLKTSQTLWYWTTIITATLTLITVLTIPATLQPLSYLRNFLGTIFLLLLPGYTFIKTLFPIQVPIKTSTENLDSVERIILSIATSMALTPLVGLLLHSALGSITLELNVLSLYTMTVVFATSALFREHKAKTKLQTQI